MASNPTPENDDVLCALAEDMADGCHALEVTVGIKQNTETVMRAALAGVNSAKLALGGLNGALDAATAEVNGLDELYRTTVLRDCRLRLVKVLGSKPSAGWVEAGFPNDSTAIPDNKDKRFTLLGKLRDYFTAHPTAESADMDATAAICAAAHTALSDARAAANAASNAVKDAMAARDAAVRTLRKRVRGLIDELGTILADDDTRYETFGLNIPANPSAPAGIPSVTLSNPGPGKIHLMWPYATRMTGTRIRTKRVGIDEDFIPAGTSEGLEKTLDGFDPGVTVEVVVISYNDGGDGPPSPVASITMPPLEP